MKKLRYREVKEVTQGHTDSEWQSQYLKLGSLAPESMLLTTRLPLLQVNFAVLETKYCKHAAHGGSRKHLDNEGMLGTVIHSVIGPPGSGAFIQCFDGSS